MPSPLRAILFARPLHFVAYFVLPEYSLHLLRGSAWPALHVCAVEAEEPPSEANEATGAFVRVEPHCLSWVDYLSSSSLIHSGRHALVQSMAKNAKVEQASKKASSSLPRSILTTATARAFHERVNQLAEKTDEPRRAVNYRGSRKQRAQKNIHSAMNMSNILLITVRSWRKRKRGLRLYLQSRLNKPKIHLP